MAYSLADAVHTTRLHPTLHAELGLAASASARDVASRFRRLTLHLHPDKQPAQASAAATAAAAQQLQRLARARDVLVDPARRLAYERFGPDATAWPGCVTVADFLVHAARVNAPFYIATALALLAAGWLRLLGPGAYWRWLALAAVATLEAWVAMRPEGWGTCANGVGGASSMPQMLLRGWLPFEALAVSRRILAAVFVAAARAGTLLSSFQQTGVGGSEDAATLRALTRTEYAVASGAAEAARLLALDAVPFRVASAGANRGTSAGTSEGGEPQTQTRSPTQSQTQSAWDAGLRDGMVEWWVGNAVRGNGEVRAAVAAVVARRQGEAVAAAAPGQTGRPALAANGTTTATNNQIERAE